MDIENHDMYSEKELKNKKKRNYFEKNPDVLFYNDCSKTKRKIMSVIKNESILNLKLVDID